MMTKKALTKVMIIFITIFLLTACNSKKNQQKTGHSHHMPHVNQIIEEFDYDKDGQLSIEESPRPIADNFQMLDSNKDGFLDLSELKNTSEPKRRPEKVSLSTEDIDHKIKTSPINIDYFIKENIIGEIGQEKINLSGIETMCYIIKTHSIATEHEMGPWCPHTLEDGTENTGIWFKDGKVYDVSGHFITELDEFYNDDKWKLYRKDGSVKHTETKEGCLAAAKPDVEEEYQNYCVECLPEYFKGQITTFVIPVKPQYLKTSQRLGRGGIGIAFNGVNYDPPAPTDAILAAHTIAPLDDHGGHVNPHGGYHYHAVTGSTKEIEQEDIHSPIVGYAIDGFGIYALEDKNGNKPTDLDECGGHFDEIRGYHYHAGAPGDNQIIKCLHGVAGYTKVEE